jgi:Domain of unknown function (DUF4787)
MVVPNVSSRNPPVPPKLQDLVAPPSILSSYYVLLTVKILLILIILFSLPKLVTSETVMTMLSTTKERRNNGNGNHNMNQHHIYKRYKYKLRSLREDCQNNADKPCASLIPEESLNCVNECMSSVCYQQVYHSSREINMEHQEDGSTTDDDDDATNRIVVIREPLEDGEIDVDRAKEFDQCVMNELRQVQQPQQPPPATQSE